MAEFINPRVQASRQRIPDRSGSRAGFDLKLEHATDLGAPRRLRGRWVRRHGGGSGDPFIQIKAKLVWPRLVTCLREESRSSRGVRSNSTRPAFEHLHSGCG
jgi:hypothetical protein